MIRKIEIGWKQGEKEGVIPIEVIYSDRRTLGLEIKGDGQVLVRAPFELQKQQLMEFISQRQEWIVEKWFLMEARRKEAEKRPKPDYEENPRVEAFYRREAKKRLEQRAAHFAAVMGVTYSRISVRAAKTRWGSCSAQGNLNFHWKLILMPPEILDYVVVHELAHRREMNHSKRFWAQVEAVLPDYRARRQWLKENGSRV